MADHTYTSDTPETGFPSHSAGETGGLPSEEEYLRAVLGGSDPSPGQAYGTPYPAPEQPYGGSDPSPGQAYGTPDPAPEQPYGGAGSENREQQKKTLNPRLSAAARKKRRKMIRIAVAAVIALLALFLLWRHFWGGRETLSTEVLTDYVEYGSILSTVEGSGVTRAKNKEDILIPFAGTVKEVLVEEGDVVSVGDPLFVVDSEDARKAVADAEKAVERANEAVEKANDGVQAARDRVREAEAGITAAEDRVREAEAGISTAENRVRDALDGVTTAQKRVETAEKNLREIQGKLEKLDIRAEYDGKLLEVHRLRPGDSVSAGTVVAVLADDSHMRLTLYFSYAYVSDLVEGQAMTVSVPRLMSEVPGVVERVSLVERITEEGSRLFAVEIGLENAGGLTEDMEATAFATINGEEVYPYESGKLEYARKREVKAEVAGNVVSCIMENYLPVTEGQILLTLDGADLDEKIADAEQDVADAEEDVETARARVTDAEKGVEDARKNVTDQQKGVEDARKNVAEQQKGVEEALKRVEEERQGVEEAEKKLGEALKNQEKCNGTAGINGKVIGLDMTVGEDVTAGKTVLTISDISVIEVNATVDERNIGYVKKGMAVELEQWGTSATGIIESVKLNSSVEHGVATYPMIISVDNTDESIQVNSSINYTLTASQSENCLIVPIQCVRTITGEDGRNQTVVYVRANLAPAGTLENVESDEEIPDGFWPVEVQVGIQDTYHVEILSGLEEGWEVFTQVQSDEMW